MIEKGEKNMNVVYVMFLDYPKTYCYYSELKFIKNGVYDIIADNKTSYNNSVVILDVKGKENAPKGIHLRTITQAKLIEAPPKPDGGVDRFYINEKKGTTVVIWKDGTKTIVKCQEGEDFDFEKGIAMCFMKKAFNDRGCYNDMFKEAIKQMESKE